MDCMHLLPPSFVEGHYKSRWKKHTPPSKTITHPENKKKTSSRMTWKGFMLISGRAIVNSIFPSSCEKWYLFSAKRWDIHRQIPVPNGFFWIRSLVTCFCFAAMIFRRQKKPTTNAGSKFCRDEFQKHMLLKINESDFDLLVCSQ